MEAKEILDLAAYIDERFEQIALAEPKFTDDGHVEGCIRGKRIKGWLRSQHKPQKRYLRWLSDNGADCECKFMMEIFAPAYKLELAHTCAWCQTEIADDVEVYGISAKARSQEDIDDWQGKFMPIELQLRKSTLFGYVVTDDSDARAQGWDIVFAACSQECAQSLSGALKLEVDVFDAISDS